jgi:hypothetical protein
MILSEFKVTKSPLGKTGVFVFSVTTPLEEV